MEDDFCGNCGYSGADTWFIETPEDFGWEYEQDCKEHIQCNNCGCSL